eukprot:scaffold41277_cov22-Tisochrysis_lutea.AAC.1
MYSMFHSCTPSTATGGPTTIAAHTNLAPCHCRTRQGPQHPQSFSHTCLISVLLYGIVPIFGRGIWGTGVFTLRLPASHLPSHAHPCKRAHLFPPVCNLIEAPALAQVYTHAALLPSSNNIFLNQCPQHSHG